MPILGDCIAAGARARFLTQRKQVVLGRGEHAGVAARLTRPYPVARAATGRIDL